MSCSRAGRNPGLPVARPAESRAGSPLALWSSWESCAGRIPQTGNQTTHLRRAAPQHRRRLKPLVPCQVYSCRRAAMCADPHQGEKRPFPHHHPQAVSVRGSQCRANADFVRALADRVGEDSIDAYRRKQKGNGREDSEREHRSCDPPTSSAGQGNPPQCESR